MIPSTERANEKPRGPRGQIEEEEARTRFCLRTVAGEAAAGTRCTARGNLNIDFC